MIRNKHLDKALQLLTETHRLVKESEEYAALAEKHAQDAQDYYNALLKREQDYKEQNGKFILEKQLNEILEGK